MFIVRKDRKAIINTEYITSIYVGSDDCSIKVDFENGKGCQIGRYNSEKEAKIALEIIINNIDIEKKDVCFMPDDNFVNAKLNFEEQKWHHATGKKTKGHGGS